MNLGAFAVVIAVARKTGSAEIDSFAGACSSTHPALTVAMTIFLFSLAGIPPLGGWFAKFGVFRSRSSRRDGVGRGSSAVVVAVNSVIALYYYANVARQMWMQPVPDDDRTPVRVPFAIQSALVLTVVATLAFGVFPQMVTRFGDMAGQLAAVAP